MDIDLVNEYTLMKHSVLPGTQKESIVDIARNHLGLHSARILTPYTTLCSRLKTYTPEMLTSQLYENRNLIKMRCMRTTLHIEPFDVASMLHMATLDLRLSDCRLFFKKKSVPIERIEEMKDELINFMNVPKTGNEIEKKIINMIEFSDEELKKECAKKILKYFWEIGILCYINIAQNWEKEERRYALTKQYYPDINFNKYDIKESQEMLILEYIKKFGPVTMKDISWWSGLSLKIIKSILEMNKKSLVQFKINDFESEFYMFAAEYHFLEKYKPIDLDWVTLLAYEDPSLKGYYESRERYVEKNFYNLLFNQIGEVRASIIHNGKAIGVWEWDKKRKCIKLQYFTDISKQIMRKVKKIKEKFEAMLYPDRQITLFDYDFE